MVEKREGNCPVAISLSCIFSGRMATCGCVLFLHHHLDRFGALCGSDLDNVDALAETFE